MPTYAILGSTGSTGQSLLNLLLKSPKNTVHAYARSRAKLERLSPQLAAHENVRIFEGELDNISLIADCLRGTTVVFVVIGNNISYPGMRVVEDGAHSVVAALSHIRNQDPEALLPKILFLTSASVNPRLNRRMPPAIFKFIHTALFHAYNDLHHAEAFLRLQQGWLDVTFIQPPGLTNDVQKGHALSTENSGGFISYLDLAAGMIEVAETEGEVYNWKGVTVVPTGKDVKFPWEAPLNLSRGLFSYYMPSVYWACQKMGLVL